MNPHLASGTSDQPSTESRGRDAECHHLPRVLVVEDSHAMGAVLRMNLERAGFDVTLATDGVHALQLANALPHFDLVLTDEQMPELSGTGFCRALRQVSAYRETPVVLLTAKALEFDFDWLRSELGITRVLPKPFSPTRVVDVLREQLENPLH